MQEPLSPASCITRFRTSTTIFHKRSVSVVFFGSSFLLQYPIRVIARFNFSPLIASMFRVKLTLRFVLRVLVFTELVGISIIATSPISLPLCLTLEARPRSFADRRSFSTRLVFPRVSAFRCLALTCLGAQLAFCFVLTAFAHAEDAKTVL
jgi:hypothetical protein